MKTRTVLALAAGTLLLAFGALVAACDDGDEQLTLEEFFQRVEEIDDQLEADSAPLEEELDQLTDESSPDEVLDILRQQADLLEEFVDELDGLDAPDEAAGVRDEAVSAGRDVVQVVRDAIDGAQDAASLEELEDFFSFFETDQAVFDRFDQACLDAEQLAADNGITIDLDCEEEA